MGVRLEHIGIAVRSLEDAAKTYGQLLSVPGESILFDENEGEAVKMAFVDLPNCRIELLEPTSPDSPIAKFLDTRGEGIHHLCFSAPGDLEDECERLRAASFRVIKRQKGKFFFLHPKDCKGSLIEFHNGEHA